MKVIEIAQTIEFDIGTEVEFKIKQGKDNGFVESVTLYPGGVFYNVMWSDKNCKSHYGFDLKAKTQ